MSEKEKIRQLLIEVDGDITKVVELEKYYAQKIVDVALEEKLYESLLTIFQPITIGGVVKIYVDAFSTDLLQRLQCTCDTKEQAEKEAREEYGESQRSNAILSEEDKEFICDKRTYEEILASKIIIPKEFKDTLKKSLFEINMNLMDRIKIKDSHARQVSGIGHPVSSVEDVIMYAEPACISACIALFNKNIRTTMNDTEGVIEDGDCYGSKCFVTCDYQSLSDENKTIFDELIKEGISRRFMDGNIDSVSIEVPCSRDETVGEVSRKLQVVVSRLKDQDVLYAQQTLEFFYDNKFEHLANFMPDIYYKHFGKEDYSWDDVIAFAQDFGYYYDSGEDVLWDDIGSYKRHIKYLGKVQENIAEQIYTTHYENGVETVEKR